MGKRARACILVLTKSRGWKQTVVHEALTAPDVKAIRVLLPSCLAAAVVVATLVTVVVVLSRLFAADATAMQRRPFSQLESLETAVGGTLDDEGGRGRAGDDISCFGAEVSWWKVSAVHLEESARLEENLQLLILKTI